MYFFMSIKVGYAKYPKHYFGSGL